MHQTYIRRHTPLHQGRKWRMKNIKVGTYEPFLEIIKQMQIGDIADCCDRGFASMIKTRKGFYYYDEVVGEKSPVQMDEEYITRVFSIRPRYVGWEKALGAAEAGKEVEWYLPSHKGIGKWLTFDLSTTLNYAVDGLDITFRDLLESRFLIKEDK